MKLQVNGRRLIVTRKIVGMALLLFGMGAWSSATAQVTFTPVTEGAIVEDTGKFFGITWGDYDNDGFLDVIVANQATGAINSTDHYRR